MNEQMPEQNEQTIEQTEEVTQTVPAPVQQNIPKNFVKCFKKQVDFAGAARDTFEEQINDFARQNNCYPISISVKDDVFGEKAFVIFTRIEERTEDGHTDSNN